MKKKMGERIAKQVSKPTPSKKLQESKKYLPLISNCAQVFNYTKTHDNYIRGSKKMTAGCGGYDLGTKSAATVTL